MLHRRVVTAATLEGAQRITPSLIGAESSNTTTINVPAGAQAGDFALLFGSTPDLRSGWTQTYNQTGAEPYFEAHHTFLPDPVPSSYTFTNMRLGILMVFRNVDSSTPLDVDPLVASPLVTTSTSPSVATANSRSLVVLGFAVRDVSTNINDTNIPAAPTGYSTASTSYEITFLSGFPTSWVAAAYRVATSAATYAPTAWQDTSTGSAYSAANMAAGTIALRGAAIL